MGGALPVLDEAWLKPAYVLASAVIAWSLWSARNGVAGDRYYRVDHGPGIPISKSAWTALNASDARGFLTISAVFAVAAIGLLRKPPLHRPEHEGDVLPR